MELIETTLGLIPKDWGIVKAKDFCDFVTDGTHDTPIAKDFGHFLVTSKNLKSDGLNFDGCYLISKEDFENINKRSGVSQFDVLYGMIGTIGIPTIIEREKINFAVKNVGVFKMGGNKLKAQWLTTFLNTDLYNNYLYRMQAGTSQQFVGLGFLRKIPILVPRNNENAIDWNKIDSIVSVLNTIDKATNATKSSIKKLEKLKKSLMQNLLSGRMKPDGSWRQENEFWIDDKFGKIPTGWDLKYVGDESVSKINPLYKYNVNQEFAFLEMAAVENNYRGIKAYDKIQITKRNSGLACYKNGDILFAKITPCTENGKISLIQNCPTKIGFGSTEFIVISPQENIDPYLLYSKLISKSIHERAVSLMEGTTGRQRVPGKIFKNVLQIIFPRKLSEQITLVRPLKIVDENITEKENKVGKLLILKKSLMQNLLSGKVRIPLKVENH